MNVIRKTGRRVRRFGIRNSVFIERIVLVLLCLGLCLFHYNVREYRADTVVFKSYLEQYGFLDFLIWRSQTWSGRLILEGALYIILKQPYVVFAVLDGLIILGTVYALRSLLAWKRFETTVFMALLFIFPADGLVEVGIQPGAINYIWALAAAIAALIPIRMLFQDQKVKWYHYAGYGVAALFGCNMEQTAAIVFCFYFLAAVYFFQLRKVKPILISQMAVSLLSLVFLMTCKGNAARLEQEISSYWHGFGELSVIDKLWNGWFTTVNYFYAARDILFILFIVVLCVWLWMKYRRVNIFTVCGTIPFLYRAGIWAGKIPDALFGTQIRKWAVGVYYKNGDLEAPPLPVYPQIILYTILTLMILVAVCGSFMSARKTLLLVLILSAGLATRLLMGFSPTLLASGTRTFFFMDTALCIGIVWYIREIWDLLISVNFN